MRHEASDVLCRDFIQAQARQLRVGFQVRNAVPIEANGVRLRCLSCTDEQEELLLHELLESGGWLLFPNANLSLRERRFVCRLHLFSDPFVRLFRALPDWLGLPGELVPPDSASLVDRHRYCNVLSSSRF